MDLFDKTQLIKKLNDYFKKQNPDIIFNELDIKIIIKIQNDIILKNDTIIKNLIKRNCNYLLKNFKNKLIKYRKQILLNNNKYFLLFIFINIFATNKLQNNIFNYNEQMKYEKILKNIFSLLINLYKIKLISFHIIFCFLEFFFELIKNNDIYSVDNIKSVVYILTIIKKIIKISTLYENDKIDKELLNKDIRQIFEKLFIVNDNTKSNDFIFRSIILKNPKILDILKLYNNYYGDNIINDNNINYIKSNLVKLFSNNFNHKHLEYLYNLSKKYILNFDNNNNISNYNQKYFSLISGIIKFLIEVQNHESAFFQNGFIEKYFLFDSSKTCGIKISPILLKNNDELGLSIIFSFYSIKADNNNPQVILTFNDDKKDVNIFKILLINKDLYIYNQGTKKQTLLVENINYNTFNVCFFYYDQNMIYLFFNEKFKSFDENIKLKNVRLINIELGYCQKDKNHNFNGFIGPVIIFNTIVNNNQLNIINKIKNRLKGQYYMIAEILNKNDINDNNNNIYFSYDEYKGALYNKLDLIKEIKQLFKNIILYINPDIILNGLIIGKTKYRDEQIYNIFDSNKKQSENINTYYIFNYNQDISNIVLKQNSLVSFIMNNHGLNYIILNIESIYNYLLVGNMDNILRSELEIM